MDALHKARGRKNCPSVGQEGGGRSLVGLRSHGDRGLDARLDHRGPVGQVGTCQLGQGRGDSDKHPLAAYEK